MRIVLLGPPGAGKGTQAELIARGKNIPHISTGEILRAAIVAGSELGEKAKSYLDSGALVPDDLIVSVVGERLLEPDCRSGYLLDGFPRTRGQAEALESFLSVGGHEAVSHVVELVVPDEELLRRVERRAALGSGRSDDNAEVFKKRLKVYWELTSPVSAFYKTFCKHRPIYLTIESLGSIEEVQAEIMEKLG